ncbi:MAG: carbohydrate ABC transporter permease [Limnochordia bacterium]
MRRSTLRKLAVGLFFIGPWIIGFLGFTLYPMIMSAYYSLTNYNLVNEPQYIGWKNYIRLLQMDPQFKTAISNTMYMVIVGLPIWLFVALVMAVLLNEKGKLTTFFRTLFYLPSVVPTVAASVLWMWVLNPQYGIVNTLLKSMGFSGPGWFTDPTWSKPGLILMGAWATGGTMIIFLAGLQNVPEALYESAELDGAGWWRKLRHITLPILTPTIFFNLIMGMISTFQYFTQAFVISRGAGSNVPPGGPLGSTLFYAIYLYQNAFSYLRMGYAAAMAWLLFIVILVFTLLLFRSSGRWVHYDS